MRACALIALGLLALAGCGRTSLPYRPDPQPSGARVSVAYQVLGDRLRIEVDTDGRRLEQAWIIKPDGSKVAAEAIDLPPMVSGSSSSLSIGIWGVTGVGRGGAIGTGASVGVPVGEGAPRPAGPTAAWFPLAPAGAMPWRLYVKLAGIEPVTFFVGGPLPGGRQ
jgi:hypothetical protein